jgi:hypothetical protein
LKEQQTIKVAPASKEALDRLALAIVGAELATNAAVNVVKDLRGQFQQKVASILEAKGISPNAEYVYSEGKLIDAETFNNERRSTPTP